MVSEMHMLFDGTDTDTQIESSLHRLYTVTGVTVYVVFVVVSDPVR